MTYFWSSRVTFSLSKEYKELAIQKSEFQDTHSLEIFSSNTFKHFINFFKFVYSTSLVTSPSLKGLKIAFCQS